ncbi:DUF962 domain-containing protein [Aquimonas voraii]|uniref:Uncharacterized membrane protein YGL010W n=1 Tax=Aquimonas voraii TaxID=265719 RepID=A0A1G6X3V8_9GAMM|nr:Mpo1-like protein [Aquimonas voraii]SDD72769.1 Uncharacterized membrane protein YGL010W [Aquimonas voraii]
MNTTDDSLPSNERRPVERLFANYADDHRNPTNQTIHVVCVPLILWSVIALLWLIPVPPALGRDGAWAGMVMAMAAIYYYRLSRPLGLVMALKLVAVGFITHMLYLGLGATQLLWLAIGVFVLAWIGQYIGHRYESKKPSFFTDLVYLLIGPAWVMGKLMRRLRIPL